MLGDQPAALYGQGCTAPRMAALTLGTGAFLWLNAGAERPRAAGRGAGDGGLATGRRGSSPTRWRRSARTQATRSACSRDMRAGARRQQRRTAGLGRPSPDRRARAVRPGHAALARRGPDHRARREQRDDTRATWRQPGWPASPTRSPTLSRPRAAPAGSTSGSAAGSRRTTGCFRPWPTCPGGRSRWRPTSRRPPAGSPRSPPQSAGARRGRGGPPPSPGGSSPASTTRGRARERARWRRRARRARPGPGRGVSEGALEPGRAGGGGGAAGARAARPARRRRRDHRRRHRAGRGHARPVGRAGRGRATSPLGTSSRSSKLIHGGLRYLEMLRLRARARGAARAAAAADVAWRRTWCGRCQFLFPLRHRVWERPYLGAGLLLYDTHGRRPPPAPGAPPVAPAALAAAPALRPDSLVGAVRFSRRPGGRRPATPPRRPDGRCQRRGDRHRMRVIGFARDETGRVAGARSATPGRRRTLEVRARHTIAAVGVATDRCSSWRPAARTARCGPRRAST